jgi:hypothetical protein
MLGGKSTITSDIQAAREQCRTLASQALQKCGVNLPETKSFELYLVRGLVEITTEGQKQLSVLYAPEFLYVMDCSLESLIGISLNWLTVGWGDPTFPNFTHAALRSLSSRSPKDLIFPNVAGKIVVGIKSDASPDVAKHELEKYGLLDVELHGFFATASCQPFSERSVCETIEKALSIVKYAETDAIYRPIDFWPGWKVELLA